MTVKERIARYLSSRRTAATSYEVAEYAHVNHNTARKILGTDDFVPAERRESICRASGKAGLTTYALA